MWRAAPAIAVVILLSSSLLGSTRAFDDGDADGARSMFGGLHADPSASGGDIGDDVGSLEGYDTGLSDSGENSDRPRSMFGGLHVDPSASGGDSKDDVGSPEGPDTGLSDGWENTDGPSSSDDDQLPAGVPSMFGGPINSDDGNAEANLFGEGERGGNLFGRGFSEDTHNRGRSKATARKINANRTTKLSKFPPYMKLVRSQSAIFPEKKASGRSSRNDLEGFLSGPNAVSAIAHKKYLMNTRTLESFGYDINKAPMYQDWESIESANEGNVDFLIWNKWPGLHADEATELGMDITKPLSRQDWARLHVVGVSVADGEGPSITNLDDPIVRATDDVSTAREVLRYYETHDDADETFSVPITELF